VATQRGWSRNQLTAYQWQAIDPQDRRANAVQQDQAAGGHDRRKIETDSGPLALARIRFVAKAYARRTYAYLVWADQGHRRELLVAEATNTNRIANLRAAWETVHTHKLTTAEGRRQWRSTRDRPRRSG
jgi:hypothetical protein